MTKPHLAVMLAPLLLASIAHAQATNNATAPFTLSWTKGKCIKCKTARRLGRTLFASRSEAWALGFENTVSGPFVVVHTADAGRTWKEEPHAGQYTGDPDGPPAISFLDHERGWISWWDTQGTDLPRLIHTGDAGQHWQDLSPRYLQHLHFFDDNHGYGIDGQSFLRTGDGGLTWAELATLPQVGFIDHMIFLTPDIGWIASRSGEDFLILRTTNGGRDWEESRTPAPKDLNGVRDLFFLDPERGWLTTWHLGAEYAFSTVDGGRHWTPEPALARALVVRFVSRDRGFAFVNDAKRSRLLYTTDGGEHWSSQPFKRYVADCQVLGGDLLCATDGFDVLTVHPK